MLVRAAAFLRDRPAAWEAATPAQRNDLARLVFQSVEVQGDRVVAVVPHDDVAPFFVARAEAEAHGNGAGGAGAVNRELDEAEATGVGSACSDASWLWRPRRIPVAVAGSPPLVAPRWPARSPGEAPAARRYARRPRKLTPAQEAAIRALARTKSLRSLAADFGVCHETVRTVLRAASPTTRAAA